METLFALIGGLAIAAIVVAGLAYFAWVKVISPLRDAAERRQLELYQRLHVKYGAPVQLAPQLVYTRMDLLCKVFTYTEVIKVDENYVYFKFDGNTFAINGGCGCWALVMGNPVALDSVQANALEDSLMRINPRRQQQQQQSAKPQKKQKPNKRFYSKQRAYQELGNGVPLQEHTDPDDGSTYWTAA